MIDKYQVSSIGHIPNTNLQFYMVVNTLEKSTKKPMEICRCLVFNTASEAYERTKNICDLLNINEDPFCGI